MQVSTKLKLLGGLGLVVLGGQLNETEVVAAEQAEPVSIVGATARTFDIAAQAEKIVTTSEPELPADKHSIAYDAYHKAAAAAPCPVEASLLAGIGYVESRHGTLYGAHIQPDGTLSDGGIRGIALDGERNTLHIDDTDNGVLDGDNLHDRAVGPMQFIPTTWAAYGQGNPQNIYDSAKAAAIYLCSSGHPTDSPAGIKVYNRSNQYVRDVLEAKDYYAVLFV